MSFSTQISLSVYFFVSALLNSARYRSMDEESHPVRPPATAGAKAPRRVPQTNDSDDQLDHYVSVAIAGGDISSCPSKLIPDLVSTLRARRDSEVASGRFNASEVSDLAFRRAQDLQDSRLKTDAQRRRCGAFKRRLKEAQRDYSDLVKRIAALEQTLQDQLAAEREQLTSRQAAEVEELTAEWDTPAKARRYNRSSNLLRQMRTQAILLLNSHRYEEMRVVERRADALQAREERQMQERMETDFENVMLALQEKHRAEIDVLNRAQAVRTQELRAASESELRVARNRIAKLENEIKGSTDSEKVWNLYHRNDVREKAGVATARGARRAGKRQFSMSDYNTLALPPLREPRSARNMTDFLEKTKYQRCVKCC